MSILFLFFIFYWSMIASQCCVSFPSLEPPLPPSSSRPSRVITEHWAELPVLYRFPPAICLHTAVYICLEKAMAPTPVLLPGKSHGQRSLVGCSPRGLEESNRTERLYFPFSLSYTGEGNGNPLQCSCLENPRDRGAWWAAVYGVAQSRTRLKRLNSSSSSSTNFCAWHNNSKFL